MKEKPANVYLTESSNRKCTNNLLLLRQHGATCRRTQIERLENRDNREGKLDGGGISLSQSMALMFPSAFCNNTHTHTDPHLLPRCVTLGTARGQGNPSASWSAVWACTCACVLHTVCEVEEVRKQRSGGFGFAKWIGLHCITDKYVNTFVSVYAYILHYMTCQKVLHAALKSSIIIDSSKCFLSLMNQQMAVVNQCCQRSDSI